MIITALSGAISGTVEGTVSHLLEGKSYWNSSEAAASKYTTLTTLIESEQVDKATDEFNRLLAKDQTFTRKVTELFVPENTSHSKTGPATSGDKNLTANGPGTISQSGSGNAAASEGSTASVTTTNNGISGRSVAIIIAIVVIALVTVDALVTVRSLRTEVSNQNKTIINIDTKASELQTEVNNLTEKQTENDKAISDLQSSSPSASATTPTTSSDSSPSAITPTANTAPAGLVYLADPPGSHFIRGIDSCVQRNPATTAMNGQDFPHSVTYSGRSCNRATNLEFNVPQSAGYSHFKASVGLSDKSQTGSTVRFGISCSNGSPTTLFASTEVQFPNIVAIDTDISQCQRINIAISEFSSGSEVFVLGDAQLS